MVSYDSLSLHPIGQKRKGVAATGLISLLLLVAWGSSATAREKGLADKAREGLGKAGDAAKAFLDKDPDPPDRDLEFRIGTVFIGTSFAIFPWRNLYIDFGVAYKNGIEKGYDFVGEVIPVANASVGIDAGAMIGVGWDQTITRNAWLDGDELSWRAGLRYRTSIFAHLSATAILFRPLFSEIEAGTGTAVPIYGGVTWTYWFLPSKKTGWRWLSNLIDIGVFARVELGPEIGSYTTFIDDIEKVDEAIDKGLEGLQPKTTFPVVRPYYNFVVGLVI